MAEAIAIGASVIAVVQITDRLIGICKFYIENVGEAAADLHAILLEASVLKTTFETLDFLIPYNYGTCALMDALSGEKGPIESCRRSVEKLEELFPTSDREQAQKAQQAQQPRSTKQKATNVWNALAWPLKKGKAKRLLEEIMQYKTTITLALTTVQSQDISYVKTKTTHIHEMITDYQAQDVYKWLKHTDPSPLHHKALKQYEAGTGDWILRTPEMRSWLKGESRCLWIYGIPGAGKTILVSHLIEHMKAHCRQLQDKTVVQAYYYAYFGHGQDEAEPFLRWIIEQLCRQKDGLPVKVYQMYKEGGTPSLSALMSAVEAILQDLDVAYIFLDAIDESSPREDLLKVVRDLSTDPRFRKLQLLVSSRNYIDIEKTIVEISKSVSMANSFVEDDIRLYVHSTLKSNTKFSKWPQELLTEAEDALAKGAQGMFRWAFCQLHMLQRIKPETKIVHETLKTLPKTLDETYDRIFLCIPEEDALLVHETFQWIHYHSKLMLGIEITCEILLQGIEKSIAKDGGNTYEAFDYERLRELCGCLISTQLENPDCTTPEMGEGVLTVSFAHYTVFEYLTSARVSNGPAARFALCKEIVSAKILETIFLEAAEATSDVTDLWENDSVASMEVSEELAKDFKSYSIYASIIGIKQFARQISQNQLLCALAIDVVDPSMAHYDGVCLVALTIGHTSFFTEANLFTEAQFWEARHFEDDSNVETRHLFNLLCLSQFENDVTEIVRQFIGAKDPRTLLQTRMDFDKVVDVPSDDEHFCYHFRGSIVEVFSQLYFHLDYAFALLLEYGEGLFDPSEILLLFVGFHKHNKSSQCEENCPLAHLLRLGANPNLSGYKVLPLQIAVNAQDFESVRSLLEAGANPNGIGDTSGKVWEDDTIMSRFNHLHNATPLYVCRNFDGAPISRYDYSDTGKSENIEKIDAILVQYGADEFIRTFDESIAYQEKQ